MNIVKDFSSFKLRFVDHPTGAFAFGIVADDIAEALDASAGKDISRSVDNEWKDKTVVATPGGNQLMSVIWEPGIRQLLVKSRKPKAKKLAIAIGLNEILAPSKEAETISIIKNAFAHLAPIEQFFILGFRIDLYFPDHRLALECDESHHLIPDQLAKDIARQDAITTALGCKWIRYNPDAPDFCIGNVINQIMQSI